MRVFSLSYVDNYICRSNHVALTRITRGRYSFNIKG